MCYAVDVELNNYPRFGTPYFQKTLIELFGSEKNVKIV
jgi:hypothetical protein